MSRCPICDGKKFVKVTSKTLRTVPCWVCNPDGKMPGEPAKTDAAP